MAVKSSTLTLRFNANIETPPANNREQFRECVIATLLSVLKTQDVTIEYIGYRPDPVGVHHIGSVKTEYEDEIFASLAVNSSSLVLVEHEARKEQLLKAFVETFQNKTHRHLEVESVREDFQSHDIEIEMSSDWKLQLRQG